MKGILIMMAGKWKKLAVAGLTAGTVIAGGWMVTRGELVTEVIDGDSFKIANKTTVRLASLNAPEMGNCMATEAKEALTKKILKKRVVILHPYNDLYRRTVALVYTNGELINEYMIRNGLAVTTREAGEENAAIQAANDYARERKLGVYSPDCFQPDPPNPKCPIKGNVDDRTHEKQYLLPDCRHYSKVIIEKSFGENYFCTEAEARKAGFTKSCDPRNK